MTSNQQYGSAAILFIFLVVSDVGENISVNELVMFGTRYEGE